MKAPSPSLRPSAGLFLALFGLTMGFVPSGYGQDRPVSAQGTTAQLPIWSYTGNLNSPRTDHTATLLPNGNVLVVGGWSSEYPYPPVSSAELYDATTGTWRFTASLDSAPGFHTATLLQNGNVLVVGNEVRQWAQVTGNVFAELYDTNAGKWSVTGAPPFAPDPGATATLLPNGKVLLVSAVLSVDGDQYPYVELYDPATATWRPAGSSHWARHQPTATLLQNGKVLVVGSGFDPEDYGSPEVPTKAELYDPVSDSWREVGTATFNSGHTATLLPNGKVLLAGVGNNSLGAKFYDPAAETFIDTGDLARGRYKHTATLLPNGNVLVAAGYASGGGLSNSAELYDPDTGRWASTGSLNAARSRHTATLLPNGSVLVAGGDDARNSAELYLGGALPPGPIGPGFTGAWYDPAQNGHGLFIEVLPSNRFLAGWFTFDPAGTQQAWFVGTGAYSGNTATITDVYQTTGGRWIPNFDPGQVVNNRWGTLTFTFTDCNHGKVDFNSVLGYGSGSMNLTRLTQPAGLSCP